MANAHDIIEAKRAVIAAQERALELAKAELAGMEELAKHLGSPPRALVSSVRALSPARAFAGDRGEGKSSGGRQPGAISQRWRKILEAAILTKLEWVEPERFVKIVKTLENRETTPSQVRRILDGYAEHGFVESNGNGAYRVTEMARDKFELGQGSAAEALNENGAPEGAPDAGGVAAPSSEDRVGVIYRSSQPD